MKRVFRTVFWVCFLMLCASCSHAETETLSIVSPKEAEKAVFEVEVADDDLERAKGLMGRTDLDTNQGMLFVFKSEDMRHFWMKDTPISLDIVFMNGEGAIVSIVENTVPNSRKTISSLFPAQYALEIRGGQAEKHDIRVGDRVICETISHSAP